MTVRAATIMEASFVVDVVVVVVVVAAAAAAAAAAVGISTGLI